MTLGRIVDEGAKVRGRAFAEVAKVRGRAFAEVAKVRGRAFAGVAAVVGIVAVFAVAWWVLPEPEPAMLRAAWTWTGASSDPDVWNEATNWSSAGGACPFPCSTADDVTFNIDFDVVFDASRTIDDLVVVRGNPDRDQTFDAGGSEYTLTCDTVSITGIESLVTIHVNGKAAIETN